MGWRCDPVVVRRALAIDHAVLLVGSDGRCLGLHWRVLAPPGPDHACWTRSAPLALREATTWALSPTDQLLQVLVGDGAPYEEPVGWICDARTILHRQRASLDWDTLCDRGSQQPGRRPPARRPRAPLDDIRRPGSHRHPAGPPRPAGPGGRTTEPLGSRPSDPTRRGVRPTLERMVPLHRQSGSDVARRYLERSATTDRARCVTVHPMNRLRRWAHEGPLRTLLMRPAVRRRIATILALRFLIATCALRSPLTFLRDWLRSDSRRSTYPTRCGATVELAPRADLEAFYEVFWRRDYDPPPTLAPRLRGARVILDLGANVGTFSAFALSRWPNARVVAYEPEPTSAAAYTHWAESTDAPVTLHIAAASTTDGTVEFVTGWGGGSHRAREGESGEAVQSRDVFADLRVWTSRRSTSREGSGRFLPTPALQSSSAPSSSWSTTGSAHLVSRRVKPPRLNCAPLASPPATAPSITGATAPCGPGRKGTVPRSSPALHVPANLPARGGALVGGIGAGPVRDHGARW